MSTTRAGARITPEQYLERERRAETRSEYHDGCIITMAGARRLHNLIAGNLFSEIRAHLRNRPGEAYMSDMRVHVGPANLYAYPDVVVVLDEPRFEDAELDTLLNPTLIAEVLSPSTQARDRVAKFAAYQGLESLREYVLLAQDRVLVECLARQGEAWERAEWSDLDDLLRLDSIDCGVPLREIYAKTPWGR